MDVSRDAEAAVEDPAAVSAGEPIEIPRGELSDAALRGVLESFVLREGTDYGEREFSLEQKVEQVRRQLERGQARILYDPQTSTVTIEVVTGKDRPASP